MIFLVPSKHTQTSHAMSVCGNDVISPNECGATPPLDIDTIPHNRSQYDSITDVYEPSKVPSHTSNAN